MNQIQKNTFETADTNNEFFCIIKHTGCEKKSMPTSAQAKYQTYYIVTSLQYPDRTGILIQGTYMRQSYTKGSGLFGTSL